MAEQSIGEVVEALEAEFPKITISKIRFLETQGLICPSRTASGYRRYGTGDVARLRWVLGQQRDHFLPLRVIRERLSSGELSAEDLEQADPPMPVARVDPMTPPDNELELTGQEMTERGGVSVAELAAMEKFGLVRPTVRRGRPVYSGDDLIAARLVARFSDHGIEARHLRPFKVAADREAGIIEQRLSGVADPVASDTVLRELIRLGEDLRALLLRQMVHK